MHIEAQISLLRLMTWMSPNFPLGAFSFSQGLETAVAMQICQDLESFKGWLKDHMTYGSGWTDAVLLGESWRQDPEDLAAYQALNIYALAFANSSERHQESCQLGAAFLQASHPWQTALHRAPDREADHYAVVVGAVSKYHAIPLEMLFPAFLQGYTSNLCNVAMRLLPIGQKQIVSLLAELEADLVSLSHRLMTTSCADIGTSALHLEIAQMQHETQEVRIFRS